ncbi:MAG TPA: hypothetical protein VK610_05255, partial [Rhodothermales bacterium]|nr:hypothetical protein [Rhodothermales bacterium]
MLVAAGCAPTAPIRAQRVEPALAAPLGDPLVDPPVLRSVNGVLETALVATPATVTVAGQTFTSNVYNGLYIPPVLIVARGDTVRLRLVNRTGPAELRLDSLNVSAVTNLHYHGMVIPPTPPADYIYLTVPPAGATMAGHAGHAAPADATADDAAAGQPGQIGENVYEYLWTVPQDHAQGLHWYHPHPHGLSEGQVLSGMSGLLIVDGMIETNYPDLASLRRRIMLLKDIRLPGAPDAAPLTKTINGQANPTIGMQPGEYQVWEIGHVGADAFFNLQIEGPSGPVPFYVMSRDGNVLSSMVQQDSLFLAPGARVTVAAGGFGPGQYLLRSLAVNTGPQGDPNPEVVLATVVVQGTAMDAAAGAQVREQLGRGPAHPEAAPPTPAQLLAQPITRRRTITFSETANGDTFFMNGLTFEMGRIDAVARVGDVE